VGDGNQIVVEGGEDETFSFDYVAGEDIKQEDVFKHVALPIIESCLKGYNGAILAYG